MSEQNAFDCSRHKYTVNEIAEKCDGTNNLWTRVQTEEQAAVKTNPIESGSSAGLDRQSEPVITESYPTAKSLDYRNMATTGDATSTGSEDGFTI